MAPLNAEEFEALLDGAEETDRIEFKGAMNWDKNGLVKDILALANIQDGGKMIIGVEDTTFARQGLSQAQLDTYVPDTMRDQIAPYADPQVIFKVSKPADSAGRIYVVIEVSPFEEFPVICKRDGADVQAGAIYYRSRAQKPQSARVSNTSDMRDIIERSVVRRMQRLHQMGLTVTASPGTLASAGETSAPEYDYIGELGGL